MATPVVITSPVLEGDPGISYVSEEILSFIVSFILLVI